MTASLGLYPGQTEHGGWAGAWLLSTRKASLEVAPITLAKWSYVLDLESFRLQVAIYSFQLRSTFSHDRTPQQLLSSFCLLSSCELELWPMILTSELVHKRCHGEPASQILIQVKSLFVIQKLQLMPGHTETKCLGAYMYVTDQPSYFSWMKNKVSRGDTIWPCQWQFDGGISMVHPPSECLWSGAGDGLIHPLLFRTRTAMHTDHWVRLSA